jgi:hypothetical protein
MDEDLAGCIAVLIIIVAVIAALVWAGIAAVLALVYIGQTVLIVAEFLAHGFHFFGVSNPTVGWALLGACGGCFLGLMRGLRKSGRKSDERKVLLAAALSAAILGVISAASAGESRRMSSARVAAAAVERAGANLRVINVMPCVGTYSTVDDRPRCNADRSGQHLGMHFDYAGAKPGKTRVVVKWFLDGQLVRMSDTLTLNTKTGWIYDNYSSPTVRRLPPGTYVVVLYGLQNERGRGQIVLEPSRKGVSAPPLSEVPAEESVSSRPDVQRPEEVESPTTSGAPAEHIRRARDFLEAGEYNRALVEAEEALRLAPNNEEARALRDQIEGIKRTLER